MNLTELQREAHAIAKEHGWWPPNCPQCGDDNTHWRDGFKGDGTQPPEEGYWACHECLEADNSPFIFESGFGFIPRRTFGDLIALVHSELSEALEAYREYGNTTHAWMELVDEDSDDRIPVGVGHELADVVIRVADMAEWYEWKLPKRQLLAFDPNESFGEHIVSAHEMLSDVRGSEPTDVLSDFVEYIRAMAAHYSIDLDAAIEAKMEYNRTRPYRHGGKAL